MTTHDHPALHFDRDSNAVWADRKANADARLQLAIDASLLQERDDRWEWTRLSCRPVFNSATVTIKGTLEFYVVAVEGGETLAVVQGLEDLIERIKRRI